MKPMTMKSRMEPMCQARCVCCLFKTYISRWVNYEATDSTGNQFGHRKIPEISKYE
ncbi:hypothetical protein LINPERPRIM_LOCUS35582 [Linum perenne]